MHPTGNANVRQAAQALCEAGALAGFQTTIAWRPGSLLDRLVPAGLRAELGRRSYPAIPAKLVHAHPWLEMVRLFANRQGWRDLVRHETGPYSLDAICAALDETVAHSLAHGPAPDAVYAYDDCALASFRAARKRGAACLYELPIGYLRVWRAMRDEEIGLEPLWGQTIALASDSEAKLARKDQEIEEADTVIVPSGFVARTLEASGARQVAIVPYGCPAPVKSGPRKLRGRGRLRVLYVGSMSQRKGISYLLKAMDWLSGITELTLIGRLSHPSEELAAQLNRHTWKPSLPHPQVLEAMRNHDVLVLPTLFEGRALVILEALSQGLPVITTLNSGTEDVVVDGVSGFIVPVRSVSGLATALTRLIEDPVLLASMSKAALEKASECSWDRYRGLLLSTIAANLPPPR